MGIATSAIDGRLPLREQGQDFCGCGSLCGGADIFDGSLVQSVYVNVAPFGQHFAHPKAIFSIPHKGEGEGVVAAEVLLSRSNHSLWNIVEFKIVNAYSIAFLDACIHQSGDNSA